MDQYLVASIREVSLSNTNTLLGDIGVNISLALSILAIKEDTGYTCVEREGCL